MPDHTAPLAVKEFSMKKAGTEHRFRERRSVMSHAHAAPSHAREVKAHAHPVPAKYYSF